MGLGALVIAVVALAIADVAPAGAASEIEGVWSFNGGEVAIKPVGVSKYEGIVVAPTRFTECIHQAGEHMWTEITPRPDGSFWGKHQWLYEKTCQPNAQLGPTAWRVLHTATGARYLEVCFSEPGTAQPTIAANGTSANVSYKCLQSSPTATLPVIITSSTSTGEQIGFARTVVLPNAKTCLRRGVLKIKINDPKHDPIKEVVVRIKKRKIADVRGVKRLERDIVLKHLPSGSYTLKIVATTVLGQKLTGSRIYHSCRRRSKRRPHHAARRGHR